MIGWKYFLSGSFVRLGLGSWLRGYMFNLSDDDRRKEEYCYVFTVNPASSSDVSDSL